MKKRYVQKILTMILATSMICSSVPVTAESVSENETDVTVDIAVKQETVEELEAEEKVQLEEGGETVEETDAANITADQTSEEGKEGNLSYCIYQDVYETKYVEITDCDSSAEGAIVIPKEIKGIAVTSIGDYAFYGCSGLTSIEIPEGVTSIGRDAFGDCSGLKDVYYAGTQEQWDAIEMDVGAFKYFYEDLLEYVPIPYTLHCNSSGPDPSASPSPKPSETPSASPSPKPSETPSAAPSEQPSETPSATPSPQPSATPSAVPSTMPSAAPSAVPSKAPETDAPAAGTKLKEKTGREFKVTESDGSESKPSVTITKLSAKDKKAKKVTIPKTITVDNVKYQVTGIAAKAFKNSKKLQTVVIPDTVTEIGASSFEGCQSLKSVTIGKNVTSIGKNAFKNCKNLKKITVKSAKLKKVGKGALAGINAKCVIKVPKKQQKSYKNLFKGKGQEKSVKITK